MKTKVILLIISASFFFNTLKATEIPSLNISQVQGKKATLVLKTGEVKNVELSVRDATGEVLYYKMTQNTNGSSQITFDFSQLQDGYYKVCLNFNSKLVYRNLFISGKKLTIGKEVRSHHPMFLPLDGQIIVSCLNPSLENVRFYVYKNGNLHSEKKLGKDFAIHKLIDTSELNHGNYEFVLANNDGIYSYELEK